MDIFEIGIYAVKYFPIIYLTGISLLAIIVTIRDKNAAQRNAWRIKERTLLTISIFGGSVAMLFTMITIRHKTQRKKFMIGIPLIIILQGTFLLFAFNDSLSVSHYDVKTDMINSQIKLALVTDLHAAEYGEGQIDLISVLDKECPDLVLFVGDNFDDRKSPDNTIKFIEAIADKFTCYYVSGNHDTDDKYKEIAEFYGVTVLSGRSEKLTVRDNTILIAGIDDPDVERYGSAGRIKTTAAPYAEQINRLISETADNELFTILLSHRPERTPELLPINPDLILSGHAHGGQWRLPMLLENGLIAPNQGLFPKYTSGKYSFDNTTLLVSRGLERESTSLIPRIFNRPEIVIITLD